MGVSSKPSKYFNLLKYKSIGFIRLYTLLYFRIFHAIIFLININLYTQVIIPK